MFADTGMTLPNSIAGWQQYSDKKPAAKTPQPPPQEGKSQLDSKTSVSTENSPKKGRVPPGKKKKGSKAKKEKPPKKRLTQCQRIARDSAEYLKDATFLFIYNDYEDDMEGVGLAMTHTTPQAATAHDKDNDEVIKAYHRLRDNDDQEANVDLGHKYNLMTLQGLKDFIKYDDLLDEEDHEEEAFVDQYETDKDNRIPGSPRIITRPAEGEVERVFCLNKLCAPYIFEQTKQQVEVTLGEGSAEEMTLVMLGYKQLFNMLSSERKLPAGENNDVLERLFTRFGDLIFFPNPDHLPTAKTFWNRMSDLQKINKNIHMCPPLSHLLAIVDPVNTWMKDLQHQECPGIVNEYLLKTYPYSDVPTDDWATQSWNDFFEEAKNELVQVNDDREEWGSNPSCSEEYLMKNGVVMKMYGNRVARGGQCVYRLVPRRATEGTGHQEPIIVDLFSICDPATVVNGEDGVFPTPLSLILKTQGQKMSGVTATAHAKIEAWMEGYKLESETHNYGRIYGQSIARMGSVYQKRSDGKLRADKVGPFPRKLIDKIPVAGKDEDKAFTAQVYNSLEEVGIKMHKCLPIRLDTVVEMRFGTKGAKIGTLTSWGIFPAFTMENVTNANSYIIQESAKSIVDYIHWHVGNKSWPREHKRLDLGTTPTKGG